MRYVKNVTVWCIIIASLAFFSCGSIGPPQDRSQEKSPEDAGLFSGEKGRLFLDDLMEYEPGKEE